MTTESTRRGSWLAATCIALAGACVYSFHALGELYDHFAIMQGVGVDAIEPAELVFSAWYLVLGSMAVALLAVGVYRAPLAERLVRVLRELLAEPRKLVLVCSLLVFAASLAFRRLVLLDHAVTDDELSYDLIASTLLHGRVVNEPPIPYEFLRSQFVIATPHAWYGKYPIGHSIVLALGQALHLESMIVSLVGAAGVWLTFAVGRRLLDERRAALACVLLVFSPQYVWTLGTHLSQPTSMVCMLLALLGALRLAEDGRLRHAALVGAALGFGLLARPMPGAPFVLAMLLAYASNVGLRSFREQPAARARELGLAAVGLAAGAGALLLVNALQSGDAATSGYDTMHGGAGALKDDVVTIAGSLFSAVLRQDFWLFGWPVSFLFIPFARFERGAVWVWGLVAAELSYRVLVPKAVVATTGPIYVYEIVPLLALATVAGGYRVAAFFDRAQAEPADPPASRRALTSFVLAATVVALLVFVPVQLRSIHRGALAREYPFQLLEEAEASRALVFTAFLIRPDAGFSWAYFPPNPSPDLSDDVVFVRMLRGIEGYGKMLSLWRERFSDRRAFMLILTPRGTELRELPLTPDKPLPPDVIWAEPPR